ncbi:MAG TPA: ATP-binding protein, partial [Candidatus Paceibacterota bacterium]|nr:ATP-binding protein [Candidatus Paceibacterota bacterium]
MEVAALVNINADLLFVGIAVAGMLLLGSITYFNGPISATNRTFFYFTALTAVWSISNYLEYRFSTTLATLWALRAHVFISAAHALFFFQLAYVFPKERITLPAWYRYGLLPLVALTMAITLTPLVFPGVSELAPPGYVTNPDRGPGLILFTLVAFGLLIAGVATIAVKAWRAVDPQLKRQEVMLAAGMALMAVLILLFNVFLPIFFDQLRFIPLAALFLLPFIGFISYSIYRHNLFDLKVATTAFLGFTVTAFTLANIVFSTGAVAIIVNVTAFFIVLIGSIKILRDTLALKTLTEELSETNARQEGLLHFIGHEVKGFMAKDEGAFAALVDGDFGQLQDGMKPFVEQALAQARSGVKSVTDILTASNQKKGTVSYAKEPFDLRAVAEDVVAKERSFAEDRGLKLSFAAEEGAYPAIGDKAKISDHVLQNIVENSIHYTPQGSVTVTLSRGQGKYLFRVQDTGVGITDEDKTKLFTEGGHGKDSQRVNAHSTGYGLYIAKNI